MAKMKMTQEHYAQLKDFVAPYVTQERYQEYKLAGHSETRFIWDALWLAKQTNWVTGTLYRYLTATHIDTALKRIKKELI